MTEPAQKYDAAGRWRFVPTRRNVITVSTLALVLLVSLISGGFGALLVAAGLIGLATALFVVITGRASWASMPSRRIGSYVVAASLVIVIVGSVVSAPPKTVATVSTTANTGHSVTPPTARPAASGAPVVFSSDDPGDPSTVATPEETSSVVIADNTVTDSTAIALLASIPIKGKAPKTGYDRTGDFGTAWLDVDRNGCDTRNDILARDLLTSVKSGPCKVMSGTYIEPYTNTSVNFVRGNTTSALIQIDHLVSLSNAWQTGAQQLTQAQRISLANDPLNLFAVDGRSNAQKGDGDTATWLPANKAFRCIYVSHQVSVKATNGLWVTQAEHDAMVRVLTDCPYARAMASTFTPAKPAPAPAPVKPTPKPTPVAAAPVAPAPVAAAPAPQAEVSYANCTAVRAAGKAPIHSGEPGYSRTLDRDGDGIACEK